MKNDIAMPFAGVVLAGGKSRRLGRDKANLVLPGQSLTLLEKALDLLVQLTPEVYVSGREVAGHACLPDLPVGEAALRGVYSAVKSLNKPCLIVACDMPRLCLELLRPLVALPGPGLTLYVHDGWMEPLCALYTPQVLPNLEAAAQRGDLRLRKAVPEALIRALPCPPQLLACLANINTPEDLTISSGA